MRTSCGLVSWGGSQGPVFGATRSCVATLLSGVLRVHRAARREGKLVSPVSEEGTSPGMDVCQGSPFSLRIPAVSWGRLHPGESLPQDLSPPSLQVARSPARLGSQHTARVAGP